MIETARNVNEQSYCKLDENLWHSVCDPLSKAHGAPTRNALHFILIRENDRFDKCNRTRISTWVIVALVLIMPSCGGKEAAKEKKKLKQKLKETLKRARPHWIERSHLRSANKMLKSAKEKRNRGRCGEPSGDRAWSSLARTYNYADSCEYAFIVIDIRS